MKSIILKEVLFLIRDNLVARSMWKGNISFGLVNIPISLYLATEESEYSFNQLCENGHRIKYEKWCPIEDREVPYSEIKKGYKVGKDNYVVIDKEDLKKIKIKTTKSIDIKEFVDSNELDPIFVDKSYYVAPDPKSANDKAYTLFVKILKDNKKIAIGKVVLKDREDLVALRPYQRGIVMHILKYLDEIRPVDEIPELAKSKPTKLDPQEISLGQPLVQKYSNKEFDIGEYSDNYVKELEKLIDAKRKGKTFVSSAPREKAVSKDLLEALKASVEIKKK